MLDSSFISSEQATLSSIDICCNYADYQILCLSGSSCICLQTEAVVNFQLYFTISLFSPAHSLSTRYMQKRFNVSAVYVDLKYCSLPTLPNKTLKLLNMQ